MSNQTSMATVEQQAAVYDASNLFPVGTPHHAAETGSLEELANVEAANRERGYPVSVTLETRDDILQCMPLHVAAEKGNLNIVEYLVKHGVDLDATDAHGVRPLHLAAITNRLEIVSLLINKGANPTKQDNEGDVPLHWAATKGYIQMMESLMDRGSSVDAPNKQGWSALHRAAFTGHVQACRLMLRRGAGLNAITKEGRTALHLAALQNQLGVMELLLDMGAGTHLKDLHGATASDLCITDAARELIQEKCAARAAGQSRRAPGSATNSRPTSSTSAVQQLKRAPLQPATNITHVPDMPRFKPTRNSNLDADGFPIAMQHNADDLQDSASAGELEGPEVLTLTDALMMEQPQQFDLSQIPSGMLSSRPSSLVSYQAAQQQPAGQLSTKPSFGRTSGRLSAATTVADGLAAESDMQQSGLTSLLAPQQKPPGPNRKFLEQYGLHRMGLFAP